MFLGVLSLTEVNRYLNVETKTDMLVDQSHVTDKLNINIDIVFERFPCEIISLDVQDVMGTHHVNVAGNLVKRRIDERQQVISEVNAFNRNDRQAVFEIVRMQIEAKEGCRLIGDIEINRVPGNFHISTHAFNDILMTLMHEGYIPDFSFKIGHISFGKKQDFELIKSKFRDHQMISPLDGKVEQADLDERGNPASIEANFYLIAVPSYFKDVAGNLYHVY